MRRIAALFLLLLAGAASGGELRAFGPGAFGELLKAREDQPFLLVLWSITCVPCREEFQTLASVREAHPALPLVLISTDDISESRTAARMLEQYQLGDVESWIFADANAQRLRYEIDPQWYGEMPRAYLYDSTHHREGISGKLTRQRIEAWIRDTTDPG